MTKTIQAINQQLTDNDINSELVNPPKGYQPHQYPPFIRIPINDHEHTWQYIYIDIDHDKTKQQLLITTFPNQHPRTIHLANPNLLQELIHIIRQFYP